jgi:hypothetical protein
VAARRRRAIPRISGFVFDVDGTLVLSDRSLAGYEVLPGAIEALSELRERSVPFVLLTNGSAYPPAEQAARLRDVGLPVADAQMITPSSVTADHMSNREVRRVLVLGSPGVGYALREAGIETVHTGEPRTSEVEVTSAASRLRMKDIEAARHAIWAGAEPTSRPTYRSLPPAGMRWGTRTRSRRHPASPRLAPSSWASRRCTRCDLPPEDRCSVGQIGGRRRRPAGRGYMARREVLRLGVTTGSRRAMHGTAARRGAPTSVVMTCATC